MNFRIIKRDEKKVSLNEGNRKKDQLNKVASYPKMSDIVYVSPQVYLVSKDKWKSSHQKPGFIPILSADIPRFQQSLQKVAKARGGQQGIDGITNGSITKGGTNSSSFRSSKATEDHASDSSKHQSLKQFFPIGLQQQLHTFSLQGVPSTISDEQLESSLQTCIQRVIQCLGYDNGPHVECWTNIRFYDLSTQDIFVRLDQSNDMLFAKICKSLEMVYPASGEQDEVKIEFHCDSNTTRFIEDQKVELSEAACQSISNEMSEILRVPEGSKVSETTNDDFFGESSDYQIDFNTLSDLPRESLSQLCKDIIEFRTRVVSIEKEKRIREAYEESTRRKHQMMRIFDQLRKSKSNVTDEMVSDESDDEQDEGEGIEEDDFHAEKQRQDKEREQSEQRYQELLKNLHKHIEPRLAALHRDIKRQQNYEKILADEQSLHLKQLLHQANDPYYDHHRSFKESEEQADETDRKEHGFETPPVEPEKPSTEEQLQLQPEDSPAPEQIKIKFAFKKAIETSAQKSTESAEVPIEKTQEPEGSAPSILALDDETLEKCLQRLKESRVVDELVKEYLGVYEDELVEYIFDNVREHKSKQVLLDDLKETFDEDAITIVDKMWSNHYWG